jgi:hypothetical protein
MPDKCLAFDESVAKCPVNIYGNSVFFYASNIGGSNYVMESNLGSGHYDGNTNKRNLLTRKHSVT